MSEEKKSMSDPDEGSTLRTAGVLKISRSWILNSYGVTDSEIARRYADFGPVLRFSPTLGWFHWGDGVWSEASKEKARQVVRLFLTDQLEYFEEAAKWVHKNMCDEDSCDSEHSQMDYYIGKLEKYEASRNMSGLMTELATQTKILVDDPALFDSYPHLLNTPNGVVDLRDGTLHPANPDWLMTRMTGAKYIPGATHADWTQALDALSELSEETNEWMQRYLGSGCSGHTLADSLNVFLHGNGANGKSTVIGGVDTALGNYAGIVPDAALQAGSGYEQAVAMLAFRGLRFALLEETTDDMRLATTAIKKLSSGNEVNARMLGKGNVTFPASHTLAIATNHTPYVREADKGTWRRLVLVPFAKDYTAEPTFDSEIRERLIEGADGRAEAVLAWLVAGCVEWYKSGRKLTPLPAELQNATNEWREDTDLLGQFINEALKVTGVSSDRTAKADMYTDFEFWCGFTGNKNPYSSQRGFNVAFKNHEYIARSEVCEGRGTAGIKQWAGVQSLGHSSVTTGSAF